MSPCDTHTNFLMHNINGDTIYTYLHSHRIGSEKGGDIVFSMYFPFFFLLTTIDYTATF